MEKIEVDLNHLASFDKIAFRRYLGNFIYQKRTELGLTQQQLAEIVKISNQDMILIEKGKKNLSQENFDNLCEYLELDSETILNMSRITHVQYLMDFFRMIDENYPR